MQVPLEISYRDVQKTEEIDTLIREKAAKLEKICHHLISCRVAVEKPQEHQRTGNPYRIRIDMRVPPGHEMVVKRESSEGNMHDPLSQVIRDAFDAARRQLQDLVERQRGEVKTKPESILVGLVVKLFQEEGYGFIQDADGREIYFHRNSVLHDDFDRLVIGTGVRYAEEEGLKGPQASTVEIVNFPGSAEAESNKPSPEPPLTWE